MSGKTKIRIILSALMVLAIYLAWSFFNEDTEPEPTPVPTPAPTASPQISPSATPSPAVTVPSTPEPTASPKVINPDIIRLREEYGNDDIVGYLHIEGTTIDYPVTQYEDNAYYLDRDINKNMNIGGWVFLDYENDVAKDDKNMIIYGHNMKQDIMFHSIRRYASEDFFKEHRYITFNTLYDKYTWEIFSFYRANLDFYYIQVIFRSDEEFFELAKQMKGFSMYDTGVDITIDDRVLTLSTCTNETSDTRFVLNAKLITE